MTKRYKKEDIDKIALALKNKEIIAFATDTVFGLGCIVDEDAKNKIMIAKGRDEKKALPLMCTKEMIKDVAYINENERKLIDAFMPGAITIIFKKKNLADFATNGYDTVAIRIPDDDWIINLINKVNSPLLVTSANLSDHGSLIKYDDVLNELDNRIDGIVFGDAKGEKASTIVSAYDDIKILREGPISKEEIMKVING